MPRPPQRREDRREISAAGAFRLLCVLSGAVVVCLPFMVAIPFTERDSILRNLVALPFALGLTAAAQAVFLGLYVPLRVPRARVIAAGLLCSLFGLLWWALVWTWLVPA